MATQAVDALQCFASLTDNIPDWIARVTELAAHTSKKHAEFSEEFKKLAETQPEAQCHNQRRRKNSSVHSIRPASDLKATRSTANDSAASVASAEGRMEGSRPRRPLVIYYDNHTQVELERMVRDIGAARNNLRKGKMAQMMRKSSLALNMFTSQSRHSLRAIQLPMDSFRRTRPAIGTETDQKESAFDFADKQLEIAHILSESAAHQFLRCGDCKKALDDIVAKFKLLLEMSQNEVSRLRAEKQHEADTQDGADEQRILTMKDRIRALKPAESLNDDKSPEPGTGAIEVDDADSESSISIDITAFRSTRLQSTRLRG